MEDFELIERRPTRDEEAVDRIRAEYCDEVTAAEILRVHIETLRRWRRAGRGPSTGRIGRRRVYSRVELLNWIAGTFKPPTVDNIGVGGKRRKARKEGAR